MDSEINEKIKVWAFFDNASIFPLAISWRRRLIKLRKVVFTYNRREGSAFVTGIVCLGEGASYELEYNRVTALWNLKKIIDV